MYIFYYIFPISLLKRQLVPLPPPIDFENSNINFMLLKVR